PFESEVSEKLKVLSKDAFLNYWNELPLFKTDRPIEVSDERYLKSYDLFTSHLLSQQENVLPHLIQHREKVLWIVGRDDRKYCEIAQRLIKPSGIEVRVIPGGHRLFQREDELKNLLMHEGLL